MQFVLPVAENPDMPPAAPGRVRLCQPGLWANAPIPPVCDLVMHFRDGSTRPGTGWLAGPDTVITTAQNLYPADLGAWAVAGVEVARPAGDDDAPELRTCARQIAVLPGWQDTTGPRCNLGCIKLSDRRFGYRTQWFGYEAHVPGQAGTELCTPDGEPVAFLAGRASGMSVLTMPQIASRIPQGTPLLADGRVTAMVIESDATQARALIVNERIFNTVANWARV